MDFVKRQNLCCPSCCPTSWYRTYRICKVIRRIFRSLSMKLKGVAVWSVWRGLYNTQTIENVQPLKTVRPLSRAAVVVHWNVASGNSGSICKVERYSYSNLLFSPLFTSSPLPHRLRDPPWSQITECSIFNCPQNTLYQPSPNCMLQGHGRTSPPVTARF
jgi:hypothetical protein